MAPQAETKVFTGAMFGDPKSEIELVFTVLGDPGSLEGRTVKTAVSFSLDPTAVYEPAMLMYRQPVPLDHTYPNGLHLQGQLTWTDALHTSDAYQIVGCLDVVRPEGRSWQYDGFIIQFGPPTDRHPPEPPEIPPLPDQY